MKKFKFMIKRIIHASKEVIIDANDEDEAYDKAREMSLSEKVDASWDCQHLCDFEEMD